MRHIVSVSLGSKRRDHAAETTFLGEPFRFERRGTDGQFKAAVALLQELDGQVDAIGLGGIDVYLQSRRQRYALRDGLRLLETVKSTPVVDGSGLKNTLERETIRHLAEESPIQIKGKRVLLVCAMDRFGMAEALIEWGGKVVFGDLIFTLGVDKPILSLDELEIRAEKLLPEICRLPISLVYPIGKKQNEITPDEMSRPYYEEAEVIAGDFHLIRKKMPDSLEGKTIITNTVTESDVAELKARKVHWLITTTPEIDQRSYGTNVIEAAMISLIGKPWEETTAHDYLDLIREADLKPRIQSLLS